MFDIDPLVLENLFYVLAMLAMCLLMVYWIFEERNKHTKYETFDFSDYKSYVGKYCYITAKDSMVYRAEICGYNEEKETFTVKTTPLINEGPLYPTDGSWSPQIVTRLIFQNVKPNEIVLEYFD